MKKVKKTVQTRQSILPLLVGGAGIVLVLLCIRAYILKTTASVVPPAIEKVSNYRSQDGDLMLSLPEPLYVTESAARQDGLTVGSIVISSSPGGDEAISSLTIRYGIPFIEGKGGACADENGTYWKKEKILSALIDVCEREQSLHAGYPKHPVKQIEYAFFIGGSGITPRDFALYKEILINGLTFISR